METNNKNRLKKIIEKEVIVKNTDHEIVSSRNSNEEWVFDFRKILLNPEYLSLIVDLFWEKFENQYPFQVGGQETAAIPLIAAIVASSEQRGTPVNGFYIRKSRKPYDLAQILEGASNNLPVVLVDDLINKGRGKEYQLKVLEKAGKKVQSIFTIVQFKDSSSYDFATDIKMESLFSLDEFGLHLGKPSQEQPSNFEMIWHFANSKPDYFFVRSKSDPTLDESNVYFGTDDGIVHALSQKSGERRWSFKTKGKQSFLSSPLVLKDSLICSSLDGNIYSVDKKTGKEEWIFREADQVQTNLAASKSLNSIYTSYPSGVFRKRQRMVALDAKTGEKNWEYLVPECNYLSSPACNENMVVFGGDNNYAYALNAKSGLLLWKFETEGPVTAAPVVDTKNGNVIFGSHDGNVYIVDTQFGKQKGIFKTTDIIAASPAVTEDAIYIASMDKNLYSVDIKTGALNWKYAIGARLFAEPVISGGHVYIGSTNGKMHEIDVKTGEETGWFQTTERITNKIALNEKSERLFLPTYANEIYCIQKRRLAS